MIKPLNYYPIKLSNDDLTNKVNAGLEALIGQDKFLAMLEVEKAAKTKVQEEAQQEKVKARQITELEACTTEEEKRKLLNKWRNDRFEMLLANCPTKTEQLNCKVLREEEERARKQKGKDKIDQYIKEQRDQFQRSIKHNRELTTLLTGCKTEREKEKRLDEWKYQHQTELIFSIYAKRDQEKNDAKEEIERHNQQAYEKARIDEISYPSLFYKHCVKKDAYNVNKFKF